MVDEVKEQEEDQFGLRKDGGKNCLAVTRSCMSGTHLKLPFGSVEGSDHRLQQLCPIGPRHHDNVAPFIDCDICYTPLHYTRREKVAMGRRIKKRGISEE